MNFNDAVGAALSQYADIEGRATRSEFWYFILLILVVCGTCFAFGSIKDRESGIVLAVIGGLGLIIPLLTVLVRRLHDTGRSGHWAWVGLVPGVGAALLILLCLTPGEPKKNRFGI